MRKASKKYMLFNAKLEPTVNSKIKVKDDLHGAAIATCHDQTGIVGILGSGSNCAYFNGIKAEKSNYGLGYILADEGSANYFGKVLLKNFLEDKSSV